MRRGERLQIALRYTFSHGRGRGQLSTFLSSLSMLGLVLAISLLIIVLSVMNGFDKEMRERILSLVPHISLNAYRGMPDWRRWQQVALEHPEVIAAAPFTEFDALFMNGARIETATGIGLELGADEQVLALPSFLPAEQLLQFQQQDDGLILGIDIARRLRANPGDSLTLIVPGGQLGGRAMQTRFESFTVSGVIETGTQLDQSLALVHLETGSRLAGLDGAVSGLRITTRDIFAVTRIGWELVAELPAGYYVTNWTMLHGNLYAAIQLSRDLVTLLLLSIIAIAAFNVVSSLVLVVFDKRGDIAILRTMGASPADIGWIFVIQGALIGVVGVIAGSGLGVAGGLVVPDLVAGLERLFDLQFLNTDVYPVAFLPVDILAGDVLMVGGVALAMCVIAAIYPARRAARLAPATILHQERA